MRILYVEDDLLLREIFLPQLKKLDNLEILIACSAEEGIKKLKERPDIDLIVSDYEMPFGNGDKILDYLLDKKLKTKFILFTNAFLPEINESAENFISIISKNSFDELKSEISNLKNPK